MALTVPELAVSMRLHADPAAAVEEPLNGILTRHKTAAEALIDKRTTGAPDEVRDQAAILLCAYWYDAPFAPMHDAFMAAWRYSGAASMLAPWTVRKTGISEAD